MVVSMVEVLWRDCHSLTDGWTALADLDVHERIIRSVGFMLDHDTKRDHVVIAQSLDDGMVDNVIAIPHSVVISVRSLVTKDDHL